MVRAKKKSRSQQAPAEATGKHPEQIASELILKFKPYLLPVLAIIIAVGIILMIKRKQARAADRAAAAAYALLDEALREQDRIVFAKDRERQEKLAKLREELQEVLTKYPNSAAASDTAFYLAKTEFERGNYQNAAAGFAQFYRDHPERQPLAGMARLGAANAFIAQNKLDKALTILDEAGTVRASSNPLLVARARYQAGLCAAMLGKYDLAERRLKNLFTYSGATPKLKKNAQELLRQMKITPPEILKKLATGLPPDPPDEEAKKKDPGPSSKPAEKPAKKDPKTP